MGISSKILCQAVLVSGFACVCLAQANRVGGVPQVAVRSGQFAAGAPNAWFSTGPVLGMVHPFQPVTGAPYSAEETTEHVQTLADGTHITQTNMQVKLYRDSAGRTRTERTMVPEGRAGIAFPSFIDITDPVAGYRYVLDQRSHTARRMTWAQPKTGPFAAGGVTAAASPQLGKTAAIISPIAGSPAPVSGTGTSTQQAGPEMKRESLGTQNIEGVTATGVRMTITYPEGFFGNDRPLTTTSETWTSTALKMTVLSTSSDPRYGDTTTRMTNIIQAEPDPSLFEIPEDYTVTDQAQGGINFIASPKQ